MTTLPPLPKIEGDLDLVLDVYTHSSLRFDSAPMNDDYGDTDRLAELGGKILDLAVTNHYYSKKPMLRATEIDVGPLKGDSRNRSVTLPSGKKQRGPI
jgi:hypothetical protein